MRFPNQFWIEATLLQQICRGYDVFLRKMVERIMDKNTEFSLDKAKLYSIISLGEIH